MTVSRIASACRLPARSTRSKLVEMRWAAARVSPACGDSSNTKASGRHGQTRPVGHQGRTDALDTVPRGMKLRYLYMYAMIEYPLSSRLVAEFAPPELLAKKTHTHEFQLDSSPKTWGQVKTREFPLQSYETLPIQHTAVNNAKSCCTYSRHEVRDERRPQEEGVLHQSPLV